MWNKVLIIFLALITLDILYLLIEINQQEKDIQKLYNDNIELQVELDNIKKIQVNTVRRQTKLEVKVNGLIGYGMLKPKP
jgi:hypothetical protein